MTTNASDNDDNVDVDEGYGGVTGLQPLASDALPAGP